MQNGYPPPQQRGENRSISCHPTQAQQACREIETPWKPQGVKLDTTQPKARIPQINGFSRGQSGPGLLNHIKAALLGFQNLQLKIVRMMYLVTSLLPKFPHAPPCEPGVEK
jgi:hypothetical protein